MNIEIVNNGITYNNGNIVTTTAYEAFINLRPNYQVIGDLWFEIFRDAVRSLFKNYMDSKNRLGYSDISPEVEDAAVRYAHLYFMSTDKVHVLIMFKSVLRDIMNGYNPFASNDDLEEIFTGIEKLLKV